MKVTKEKVENSQAYLTIEMEPAEVEKSMQVAYQRLVRRANIPGFRKGKAPRAIVERYFSKEGLLEEALNYLIPEAYENAIKEQNLDAVAPPQIEVIKTEPLEFKAIVPLKPTVELGDYQHIQVKAEPAEVKEEEINEFMDGVRQQHMTWEPVERAVDFNDLVTIDVESTVDGKPFMNQDGAEFQVLKDLASPLPGFSEQLPGMKKGEVKEFTLKFPDDYAREGFAGKEAAFKVKLVEVKQGKLPDLTDEFAQKVNAEFKTVDLLRERVSANLKVRADEKARIEFEEHAVDAAVEGAKVEFPPALVEREIDRLISDQSRRLQLDARGLEEYLKGIKKTGEELREDLRPLALKRVTRALVLDKVAEAEKLEVADADIDAEIENILKTAAEKDRDALRGFLGSPESRDSIQLLQRRRKTIQRLAEIGKGSGATETVEKEEKK